MLIGFRFVAQETYKDARGAEIYFFQSQKIPLSFSSINSSRGKKTMMSSNLDLLNHNNCLVHDERFIINLRVIFAYSFMRRMSNIIISASALHFVTPMCSLSWTLLRIKLITAVKHNIRYHMSN